MEQEWSKWCFLQGQGWRQDFCTHLLIGKLGWAGLQPPLAKALGHLDRMSFFYSVMHSVGICGMVTLGSRRGPTAGAMPGTEQVKPQHFWVWSVELDLGDSLFLTLDGVCPWLSLWGAAAWGPTRPQGREVVLGTGQGHRWVLLSDSGHTLT